MEARSELNETGTGTEAGMETRAAAEMGTGTGAGTETGAETGTRTEVETGTRTGAETGTGARMGKEGRRERSLISATPGNKQSRRPALLFRKHHHLCRQELVSADSQQLQAQFGACLTMRYQGENRTPMTGGRKR